MQPQHTSYAKYTKFSLKHCVHNHLHDNIIIYNIFLYNFKLVICIYASINTIMYPIKI